MRDRIGSEGDRDHAILPILCKWANLTQRYFEKADACSFVYREETNVSLIVASAWALDCPAISEFQFEHNDKERRDRVFDVSVWTPPGEKSDEWFIEAKVCWQPVHEESVKTEAFGKKLSDAYEQIETLRLTTEQKKTCVGLIFFVPEILAAKGERNKDLLLPDHSVNIVRLYQPECLSWCFPTAKKREMAYTIRGKGSKYFRPGVVAALFSHENLRRQQKAFRETKGI